MPYRETGGGWKQCAYVFAADATKTPREIDLIAPNEPVGRGIYEFTASASACVKCHGVGDRFKLPGQDRLPLCVPAVQKGFNGAYGLRLALSVDGTRPAKFGGNGVIVFEMTRADDKSGPPQITPDETEKAKRLDAQLAKDKELRAAIDVRRAEVELQRAQAEAEVAQVHVLQATANLKAAQDKLAAAEKAAVDLKKPPAAPAKGGAEFTVHVRTLTAAEKVVRVKDTGNSTVLDALANADGVTIKPDAVSVWVVRDGAVLPVDLGAITQQGVTKTNYVLKSGDQLFVQVKAVK